MFGKFLQHDLKRSLINVKNHLSNGYNQSKRFCGQIDSGMSTAKKIFGVLAPVIEQYGGGHFNKQAIKALGGYEQIRGKVVDEHEGAKRQYDNVVSGLAKQGIGIGLN